ncbi:MAG: hypothetical protein AB1578_05325 [Thermodesulfobacteriota bacterium]
MGVIGIHSFRYLKLCVVLVLAALAWSLAAPHCVEASPSSSACDVSIAGSGCCGASAPKAPDCDTNCLCPCPCSQVPGFSSTPKIQPLGVTSVVPPCRAAALPSAVEAPPAPVPIAG